MCLFAQHELEIVTVGERVFFIFEMGKIEL